MRLFVVFFESCTTSPKTIQTSIFATAQKWRKFIDCWGSEIAGVSHSQKIYFTGLNIKDFCRSSILRAAMGQDLNFLLYLNHLSSLMYHFALCEHFSGVFSCFFWGQSFSCTETFNTFVDQCVLHHLLVIYERTMIFFACSSHTYPQTRLPFVYS